MDDLHKNLQEYVIFWNTSYAIYLSLLLRKQIFTAYLVFWQNKFCRFQLMHYLQTTFWRKSIKNEILKWYRKFEATNLKQNFAHSVANHFSFLTQLYCSVLKDRKTHIYFIFQLIAWAYLQQNNNLDIVLLFLKMKERFELFSFVF